MNLMLSSVWNVWPVCISMIPKMYRARKDRHANIGFGEIGFEKLNAIVHNERVKDVVKILETPYVEDHPPYRQEIAMLRSGVFDEQIMEKIKGDI